MRACCLWERLDKLHDMQFSDNFLVRKGEFKSSQKIAIFLERLYDIIPHEETSEF